MTSQHGELVEKVTSSDNLAVTLQKEVAALNEELAGAQASQIGEKRGRYGGVAFISCM